MGDRPKLDPNTQVAIARKVGRKIHELVLSHLRRERAGSSASMNPALEYAELDLVRVIAEELGFDTSWK